MRVLKQILLRLLLVCFSLLFTLLLLEVFLRVAGLGKPIEEQDSNFDRSPVTFYQAESRQHPWTRDPTNVLKIAVIGDSFSNAHSLQYDDTYGLRLERLLNLNDGVKPAEVRLYAKGGTSTYMQIPFLEEAFEWRPDIVILGICVLIFTTWAIGNPQNQAESVIRRSL